MIGSKLKSWFIGAKARKRESAREASQQDLAKSYLRFQYAAQATSDAIWDRTYSENIISWGEGFRTLFGYDITPETKSVSFWESKVHPEDLEKISKIIQTAKTTKEAKGWAADYRFLKANGDYAYVREKAIILRDEKGTASETIGAVQDITECKQNEIDIKEINVKLAREKYFLDTLMDNMPDTIYFKDRESRIVRSSKFMAAKFGLTVDEILGKSDFDLHNKIHATKAWQDEQNIQLTRQAKIDYIERIVKEDGEEQLLSTTKMPLINDLGEVIGTFGMSRDVTKVRKLEKEQHDVQLDKAVALGKYEIASDVMHDIGNAVVGFGSYLSRIRRIQNEESPDNLKNLADFFEVNKKGMTEAIGETKTAAIIKILGGMALTQRSNQEEVLKSITQQLGIITHIQEILDIQRQYVSGYDSQERKPVNLRNIINDSLAMLYSVVEKMSIEVTLNIPADLPLIKGDRTKLMQVMLSILKNSIESFEVDSESKSISLTAIIKNGKIELQVKDNGRGFDLGIADPLCTQSTKEAGIGMGLHNCKAILTSHEGNIVLTSEGSGKGSLATLGFMI